MREAWRITLSGVVQGVGYRPYAHQLAARLGVDGWADNAGSQLRVFAEGESGALSAFADALVHQPPGFAVVERVKSEPAALAGRPGFHIRDSVTDVDARGFLPPDMGTCPDCLSEVFDPGDRRYGYPFANCTACGPRHSMLRRFPYDRANTTMAAFPMCAACREEYENPGSRRFHAQPNCCPQCGPRLWLVDGTGKELPAIDPILAAAALLKDGHILAVKGLGGFHLACDARNEAAVLALRERKRRPHKPLAVMARDMQQARQLCALSAAEEKALLDQRRPILLARAQEGTLPAAIAPNSRALGILLPYTPLHALLLREISPLVMTSGNHGGEPIQHTNRGALDNLAGIADAFLLHDRGIHMPVEDSVARVVEGELRASRLARGFAPAALRLPHDEGPSILAMGAPTKSALCVSHAGYAHLSPYLGDIGVPEAFHGYERAAQHLLSMLGAQPQGLAVDLAATDIPASLAHIPRIPVQHHHAHMASCMLEHALAGPAIGVVFDGTGMGADRNCWGGEFFAGGYGGVKRAGHLLPVRIQGAEQAVREPFRAALSYLDALGAGTAALPPRAEPGAQAVIHALRAGANCFISSSMGRLFDAVASILGVCQVISYDGQSAIELEQLADPDCEEAYPHGVLDRDGQLLLDWRPLLSAVLADVERGGAPSRVSARFHNAVARATLDIVGRLHESTGIADVVFSGGVLENRMLLEFFIRHAGETGCRAHFHRRVPANDQGVALGQLAVALKKGV